MLVTQKICRTIFSVLMILVLAVVLVEGFINWRFQSLNPNSNLSFWQTRISSLPQEFLRRSPKLRNAVEEYREVCYKKISCNEKYFFRKRDKIIREEWPKIAPKLQIADDWGEGYETAHHKVKYFHYLRGFGAESLRLKYVPVLHYRNGVLRLEECSLKSPSHFISVKKDPALCK